MARGRLAGSARRRLYAALAPALPAVLLLRMTVGVMKKRRCRGAFLEALPLTIILTASWSCGELVGYVSRPAVAHPPEGENADRHRRHLLAE